MCIRGRSGEALTPLGGHQGAIVRFVFSDDGARLVTTSFDRTARVFDVATGESRELRDLAAPVVDAGTEQRRAQPPAARPAYAPRRNKRAPHQGR